MNTPKYLKNLVAAWPMFRVEARHGLETVVAVVAVFAVLRLSFAEPWFHPSWEISVPHNPVLRILIPILIGIAAVYLVAGVLSLARLIGPLERSRARRLGSNVTAPRMLVERKRGLFGWVNQQTGDINAWRALLYVILSCAAVAVSCFFAYVVFLPENSNTFRPLDLSPPKILLNIFVLFFALVFLGRLSKHLVRILLGPSSAEYAQAFRLRRDQAVETALGDLKRVLFAVAIRIECANRQLFISATSSRHSVARGRGAGPVDSGRPADL
ncbi:MAG TPA: sensor domain-containing protein [Mycobacteriales bacterium]|jgi:hypothetical protein|nr:sensor domain-containing protein [Mycobacteriales bacterium]